MCALQYVFLVSLTLPNDAYFPLSSSGSHDNLINMHVCHIPSIENISECAFQFIVGGIYLFIFLTLLSHVKDDRGYLGGGARIG